MQTAADYANCNVLILQQGYYNQFCYSFTILWKLRNTYKKILHSMLRAFLIDPTLVKS